MRQLSRPEAFEFLAAAPRTGKLATVRADGRPHLAPIWFAVDGETLLFTTWHTSVKAVNLRRDPRASLCVDDDRPPFAFVVVEGTVAISEDPADLQRWAAVIAGRYMGADQAAAYGQRNGVAGEWLCRLTPTKLIAQSGIAD